MLDPEPFLSKPTIRYGCSSWDPRFLQDRAFKPTEVRDRWDHATDLETACADCGPQAALESCLLVVNAGSHRPQYDATRRLHRALLQVCRHDEHVVIDSAVHIRSHEHSAFK